MLACWICLRTIKRRQAILLIAVVVLVSVKTTRQLLIQQQPQIEFIPQDTASSSSVPHQTYKPTLYLHVGPPKTATTSLQCVLCTNQKLSGLLLRDNLVYLGTCPIKPCGLEEDEPASTFFPHRFRFFFDNLHSSGVLPSSTGPLSIPSNWTQPNVLPPLTASFQQRLNQLAAGNASDPPRDALLIFEGMHRFHFEWIASMADFLLPSWNVKVIVAYRRLHEWLPSKYNSVMKLRTEKSWSSKAILPFELDGPEDFHTMVKRIETIAQHPTETVARNYRHFFDSVQVWNIHQAVSGNLLQDLFCHVLETTPTTCHDYPWERDKGNTRQYNPSRNLDYDRLTMAAFKRGLIPSTSTKTRKSTSRGLEWALRGIDLPVECWNDEKLERLEKLSRLVEENLFSYLNETVPVESKLQPEAFCRIDVESSLQMTSVKNVLSEEAH